MSKNFDEGLAVGFLLGKKQGDNIITSTMPVISLEVNDTPVADLTVEAPAISVSAAVVV